MTRAVDPSCWNEAFDLEDCTKLAQIAQWCARKIDECSKHFKIRAEEVKYFDVNRRWFCGHLMYHDVEAHHSRSSETDNLRDRRFDPLPLKLYLSKFAGVAGSKCPGIQSSLDMARLTSNAPTKVPFLIGCRFDVLRYHNRRYRSRTGSGYDRESLLLRRRQPGQPILRSCFQRPG